jgi:hypothetical protein
MQTELLSVRAAMIVRAHPSVRRSWRWISRIAPLYVAVLLGACEANVGLVAPRAFEGEPTLRITVHVEDETLAELLGWQDGVPGATVWLHRELIPGVEELQADSLGRIELSELPAANYWVWAERQLTAEERDLLGGSEVRIFGGGDKVFVGSNRLDELELGLGAEEPGSLVLSEFSINPLTLAGGSGYYSMYFELYNNADSTIYLDGMIFGHSFIYPSDSPYWPCAVYEQFRSDPEAIYANHVLAFPGSGSEYPVFPGQKVLIAAEAIDHDEIHPGRGLPDLRGADFQLQGSVLNPEVPGMIDVGPRAPLAGWGRMFGNDGAPFVARAVDVSTLERVRNVHDSELIRFPRELLLDLAHFVHPIAMSVPGRRLCGRMVPPNLDRLEGIFGRYPDPEAHRYSIHRRRVPGTDRLLRTRTTMLDFEHGSLSPGSIR